MTGKRALAQDGLPGSKSGPHFEGMKRRKLLHNGAQSLSPKRIPSNVGGKQKASIIFEEACGLPNKSSESWELERKAPQLAEELAQNAQERNALSTKWSITQCSSGRFLNVDPVFTSDGRYVIIATDCATQVFSIATSCVVRALPTAGLEKITALKLSPKDTDCLYASTTSGSITRLNWQSGTETQIGKKPYPVIAVDPQIPDNSPGDHDLFLFALGHKEKGNREISIVLDSDGPCKGKTLVVLETSTPLSDMKVVSGGKIIVAWAGDRLLVGLTASQLTSGSFTSLKYVWREVRLPVCATSVDIRFSGRALKQSKKTQMRSEGVGNLDIALGESGGSILIYYDILGRLLQRENNDMEDNLVSNRLHWHRKPVKTIKWSRDGNYIISGGLETVLVLWQLDTGRKQFLPHLSAPICNLVVSPTGTSYAIKLGDNSLMVLSTAELRPIANISGLQLPFREDILGRPQEVKRSRAKAACDHGPGRIPALLHPINPNLLMLAVPSTQLLPSMETSPSASVLQVFDIHSGHHISRQALTRTNVSVLNSGPQGTEVTTPDMKFVRITSNGDWLATVDEWQQYPDDANVLHPGVEEDGSSAHREMFLKIWHWNETGKEWQLVTRVDKPHFLPSGASARALGLTVQSEGLGFATVGSDAVVRVWSPEYRYLSKRKNNSTEQNAVRKWRCSKSVLLRKQTDTSRHASACVAFSNDDSILAVCWPGSSQNDPSLVYLIDPVTGSIRCTKDGIFAGPPRGAGFLDRYLVILSDRLVVWDIVSDEVKFSLVMEDKYVDSLLAVNPLNHTFAIAFAFHTETKQRRDSEYELAIFKPTTPRPVYRSSMKSHARSLLPDLRTGSYIVVDSAAQVMRVSYGDKTQVPAPAALPATTAHTGLEDLFGGRTAVIDDSGAVERTEDEQDLSGAGSLANIFDSAPSFALPTVDVLFQDVVDVFNHGSVVA